MDEEPIHEFELLSNLKTIIPPELSAEIFNYKGDKPLDPPGRSPETKDLRFGVWLPFRMLFFHLFAMMRKLKAIM